MHRIITRTLILEITGKLSNIDSSGKYINLDPVNSDFSIYGVQCYISDDAQRNAISNMKKGDTITLKGQCTDVGEVLGTPWISTKLSSQTRKKAVSCHLSGSSQPFLNSKIPETISNVNLSLFL